MAKKTAGRSATDQPSVCSCVNLRRASRAITRLYDQALEPAQLKVTQYSVLVNLMRSGTLTASALGRMLRLDRTTLVRNLKGLETAGFIEGAPASDPRERGLSISDSGRAAVERARPCWDAAQKVIEGHLGVEETARLGLLAVALERILDGNEAGAELAAESDDLG